MVADIPRSSLSIGVNSSAKITGTIKKAKKHTARTRLMVKSPFFGLRIYRLTADI
jgi:hypothetical protein